MLRMGAIVAGLILALFVAAPASANTIATFELDGVTFSDGGTATGTFKLDLTTHTLVSSSITTSFNPILFLGADYNGSFADSFLSVPTAEVTLGDVVIPFVSAQLLTLTFGLTDSTYIWSLPSFVAAGSESTYSWLCGGLCGTRTIVAGSINTIAATPIPAALPLLATALGGLAFAGWRRRRHQQAA
jgi:hypothetical protein